jgi:hypothetical protein
MTLLTRLNKLDDQPAWDWEAVHDVLAAEMERRGMEVDDDAGGLEKGGSGSGHHGHKGIPGQRGGSMPGRLMPADVPVGSGYYEAGRATPMRYVEETSSWEGLRGDIAAYALESSKYDRYVNIVDGEVLGVMAINPRISQGPEGPEIELVYLATKQPGVGRRMMQEAVNTAAEKNTGLHLSPIKDSVGFYERLGMHFDEEEIGFYFTPEECQHLRGEVY